MAGVTTSYLADNVLPERGGSEVVYYAQPPDVLYVGEAVATDEAALARPPPTGTSFRRFPLPWYTEAAGADVASVPAPANLTGAAPPVQSASEPGKQRHVGGRRRPALRLSRGPRHGQYHP